MGRTDPRVHSSITCTPGPGAQGWELRYPTWRHESKGSWEARTSRLGKQKSSPKKGLLQGAEDDSETQRGQRLTPGHTARKEQRQDLNPGFPSPSPASVNSHDDDNWTNSYPCLSSYYVSGTIVSNFHNFLT